MSNLNWDIENRTQFQALGFGLSNQSLKFKVLDCLKSSSVSRKYLHLHEAIKCTPLQIMHILRVLHHICTPIPPSYHRKLRRKIKYAILKPLKVSRKGVMIIFIQSLQSLAPAALMAPYPNPLRLLS
jgi:hypothetical protein